MNNNVNDPLVSVVIPTYNYGHYVCDAVDSALAQTYKNLEVIVVDDGSTDNTRSLLKAYQSKIRCVFQSNRGLSAARNEGIRQSRGGYVAFLDADDIWLPEKISEQVRAFLSDPRLGLVSCSFMNFDDLTGKTEDVDYPKFATQAEFKKALFFKNIVSGGSCAVVKKELFNSVGDFDENLRSAEDWDMWLRLSACCDIKVLENKLVKVRTGFNSMSSFLNADKMLQSELKVYRKQLALNGSFRNNVLLRLRVLSYRFNRAAWAYMMSGRRFQALNFILRSVMCDPLAYFRKSHLGLLVRILSFGFLNRATSPTIHSTLGKEN